MKQRLGPRSGSNARAAACVMARRSASGSLAVAHRSMEYRTDFGATRSMYLATSPKPSRGS